jgi:hypothetical protein
MYQLSKLKNFTSIIHGFSTRKDGNMSFRFGNKEEVSKNREKFLSQLGIRINSCVSLKVQHKVKIVGVGNSFAGRGMLGQEDFVEADGLVTKDRGLYLFLLIADCLPIILYDPKREVVGAVHSGWRSTNKKIVSKAISRLADEFGCNPSDIFAAIGPAIHKESYLHRKPFQKDSREWRPFLKDLSSGETAIDLIGANVKQIEDAGVLSKNIFVSKIDTVKDRLFFSHYRDSRKKSGDEGRFACVVGIR